ncbi:MAG: cysS [Rickettsiaceae bacterium]|jgi:cysteinyl-tRNA synthetase|nr:cysS [Rickettsiaceae bacterium]
MTIKLFNSLSKAKEVFVPLDKNNIKIYVCGPTVYDRPHIGNARSIVVYDLWFRLFSKIFPKVTYVRNITDVDDKINAAALAKKISIQDLTNEILKLFYHDIGLLNVLPPSHEPKATEHIGEMISIIEKLLKNNHAYISNGHVLFDVKSYKNYGHLSNRHLDEMIAGARVEPASYKKDPLDFVLWKPTGENDDESSVFDSPWGKGRPGWHIECSAMSSKYLGDNFDIHGGGADLQFPHHENEIAQSRCANENSFYAKYWVHNGFLTVNGEKMSKSLNNFFTIKDLLDKNIHPMAIRYLLLSTHYHKPLDFNDKALFDAKKSIEKFYNIIGDHQFDNSYKSDNQYLNQIIEDLSDDLNTPLAFSVLHEIVKSIKSADDQNKMALISNLIECLDFLGLYDANYSSGSQKNEIDENYILERIEARKAAKAAKNWAEADAIRKELLEKNVAIEDGKDGEVKWRIL